ncbi:hypothetical protein AgCh_011471 [Apium graveolens]
MAIKLIASELAKTERLNGTNYDMWSRKIRYALIHDNLESAIEESAPIFDKEHTTTPQKKEYDTWKPCDKKAKSLMQMYTDDSLIKVFEVYATAKNIWDAIKEKYDTTSDVNVQILLHRYNTCKMKKNENVTDHCNKMIVMAKDLAAAGNELSENMQIAGILNSLPRSLDMVATTLRHSGNINKVDDLPAALVVEQDLVNSRKEPELNYVQEDESNIAREFPKHRKKNQMRMGPSKGKKFKP